MIICCLVASGGKERNLQGMETRDFDIFLQNLKFKKKRYKKFKKLKIFKNLKNTFSVKKFQKYTNFRFKIFNGKIPSATKCLFFQLT